MTQERDNNKQLPALFKQVLENLPHYNAATLQQERMAFAYNNTYTKKIVAIEQLLSNY